MSKNTLPNLEALRDEMKRVHVDAVIIPGTDAHQSEYVCEHWKIRDWLTGFTGSNGTAVVTLNDAKVWTDSRYFLQATAQLEGSGFEMMKEDVPGEPTLTEWLAQNMKMDDVLAVDGTLFSIVKANELENFCGENGFRFAADFAPFDKLWENRPARPQGEVYVHDEKYAGESVEHKINRVLEVVEKQGADAIFFAGLDETAWLLNIRCDDVAYTPVAICYSYISAGKKALFIDETKINDAVREHLNANGVEILPYEEVAEFLGKISNDKYVMIDPNRVSDTLGRAMDCGKVYAQSPIMAFKAIKNDVQIAGVRKAMERDGVALVKMYRWLEANVAGGQITEMGIAQKLIDFRAENELYRDESFGMIAGYKEHGAIVHYSATPETNATVKPEGMLLVDTGAQYLDGTTDITRTITLGNTTEEEKHDYTLVLKGHIAIITQIFPAGTRGAQLDPLARQFMWRENKLYLHGTGHGVGHFLGVHEGPQSIRLNENPTPMMPGMITSDEPGLYLAGKYGIRIENLTLVVPADHSEEFGDFYKFEPLTLYPYESKLIDVKMLTDQELEYVNSYNEMVRVRLTPYLNAEEAAWLAEKTAKIER